MSSQIPLPAHLESEYQSVLNDPEKQTFYRTMGMTPAFLRERFEWKAGEEAKAQEQMALIKAMTFAELANYLSEMDAAAKDNFAWLASQNAEMVTILDKFAEDVERMKTEAVGEKKKQNEA